MPVVGNDVYKVIYLLLLPVYMAKLYWRIKRDGKWTWTPAIYDLHEGQITHPDGELVTLWWPSEAEETDGGEEE